MRQSTYDWYQDMVRQTQRRLAALDEVNEDPERYNATHESAEGIVATMAPNGAPVALRLSRTAMRMGPEELAEAILAAQRAAAADAAERYTQALRDAVPDGAMGRFDTASVRAAGERLREEMLRGGEPDNGRRM